MKSPSDGSSLEVEGVGRMPDTVPAIRIQDVTVRFQGKTILARFSLDVGRGEKVVLSGESGIGKSTLLRCLLGFVIPQEGRIFISGEPLTADTVWRLRRLIAYVPQEPDLGDGLLREWLEKPFSYRGNAHLKENLKRIPEFLERFSLSPELLDKETGSLSGGEKQRVAMITAILLGRKIFLLDEPTSALDEKNGRRVLETFRTIPDATILVISHDPLWLELADRTVELGRGGKNGG
ncbi:MAG: ABC transporter ATP-binding protein [Deltaproteobacteria bacterium]|nr:ABC transporter ATP-binding protein [Deltaproteobacteria bacterium]